MTIYWLILLILRLHVHIVPSAAVSQESTSDTLENDASDGLAPSAFTALTPRPDLFSIPCFACVMEECPEVRRYGANATIWMKCAVGGTLSPAFGDTWAETVDGCYIMYSDFQYYPHWSKREAAADPICDREKALRMPNATLPHAYKRQDPEPTPTYVPAIIDSKHDKKCLVCADPLCQVETTYTRNASIELECWSVSTMGPGEVISFPNYDERWIMTKEGCYLALNEVSIPSCTDPSHSRCMPYCEPPPHYWATIKDYTLAKECATNCSGATAWLRWAYVADFDCWDYGDVVQGNNTWYKGTEVKYGSNWYTVWWPKAALGQFGGTGEPPNRCLPNGNSTEPERRRQTLSSARGVKRDVDYAKAKAIGHPAPRAVQVVYAYVNEVDTRCRLCTKRICPYYTVYQPGDNMEFNCFVYGSVVDGSDIWLKSGEAVRCYVPRRYITLNGGSSISYCRDDNRRSIPLSESVVQGKRPATFTQRAPAPQVSDPSQSPDPPNIDGCQNSAEQWEQWCYNQALACCVNRTEIGLYWACSSERYTIQWKDACRDLRTRTNCSIARRLGNQMEGCEGGDVYRDPS